MSLKAGRSFGTYFHKGGGSASLDPRYICYLVCIFSIGGESGFTPPTPSRPGRGR